MLEQLQDLDKVRSRTSLALKCDALNPKPYTHTCIVDGYKILPVPMGMKLYPYSYPVGTRTHWVTQRVDQIIHKLLTFLLSSIVHWGLERRISIALISKDMWITTNA
jgi:hypothetical protein